MKKNILWSMLMLMMAALMLTACSDSDDVPTTPVSLSVQMPLGIDNVVFSNAKATLTNVNTNEVFTVDQFTESNGIFTASLASVPEGTYNVEVTGDLTFTKDGLAGKSTVSQKSENVAISSSKASVNVAVNTFNAEGGFVISELFYAGTEISQKAYTQDQYVIISNNSDVTLYADSIAFLESAFLTTTKYDYTPDIMSDYMTVDAIYMIPGNGTDVAVEPGGSLVLALNAKNHTEANPNSFSTANADFEFYDVSTSASNQDEDNTNVPNLDKWYCYTKSFFMLAVGGNRAYAIARLSGNAEQYLADNQYEAKYIAPSNGKEMTKKDIVKVANSSILDAVNLAPSTQYVWSVVASSLDAGYTYVATTIQDKTRWGKAVIRKKVDGKWVDTNNSSNDFEIGEPSLSK